MYKKQFAVGAILILVLAMILGLKHCGRSNPMGMPPSSSDLVSPPTVISTTPAAGTSPAAAPVVTPVSKPAAKPAVKSLPKEVVPTTQANGTPTPPKLELHKELIPKDITIVRCYYSMQGIAPPGTTFGFDINGSGFTSEFQKMITVESGVEDVHVENLHLVTTNQIHGDMVIGPKAATTFIYPRVLIKGLPVFRAPEPFAVVRPGEVLTIFFISMEENGRGGRFRVITNITDDQFKNFQVAPSTPGLTLTALEPHLPYVVESSLHIGPGVPPGDYGLEVTMGDKKLYHHDGMIHIVRPNVGQSGFVLGLVPVDKYHRPGDTIELYLQGTGFAPANASTLKATVDGFDMGVAGITYLSPAQMRVSFKSPTTTPVRSYGIHVTGTQNEPLFNKDDLFEMVPADWIEGVQVSPPVKPGDHGTLKIVGRDFSPAFLKSFHIDMDEPGISVQNLKEVDASTLSADIAVAPSVAPGDYWLHLSTNGEKIDPPYGSIIKVQSN